ncbi:MAG: hypothetical protein IOD15_00295 [Phycisphaerales bacterium]|nr:hypothetical protein [Phycisphaerales bacterium]
MNDIVWYIVFSPDANTHVISPVLPPSPFPYAMKEVTYSVGYPAVPAISDFVSAAEQLRNGGSAAQQIAVKVTMKAPAGGPG